MKKHIFLIQNVAEYIAVEIFGKNIESDKPFDCKREVKIEVHEALPVTNTKVTCDKAKFLCNESITFTAYSEGWKRCSV